MYNWTPDAGSYPVCQLLVERCHTSRDCEKKSMECRLDENDPRAVGHCVEARL